MELLSNCPVCNSSENKIVLEGCDFFLTKEKYTISVCLNCGLRFTNPRPGSEQIQKYYESAEYISHNTNQKGILTRAYKLARRFTLRKKLSIIRNYSKGKVILDIGCGTGDFLNYCQENDFIVYGVEPNEKPRKSACNNFKLDVRENLTDFSSETVKFDCVTLWHVLEHIHDLNTTMLTIKKLLNPGGIIIIALPNMNSWDAYHYGKYWAAYDLPRHLYHFNFSTFDLFARNNGFKINKIIPQTLDSFYISLLSEKYLSGKTKFVKAFIFGLYSNLKAKKPDFGHSSIVYILDRENY